MSAKPPCSKPSVFRRTRRAGLSRAAGLLRPVGLLCVFSVASGGFPGPAAAQPNGGASSGAPARAAEGSTAAEPAGGGDVAGRPDGANTVEATAGGSATGADYRAATADLAVSSEALRIMVKPLLRGELEVEAKAWRDLLRATAQQIADAQLQRRGSAQAEGSGGSDSRGVSGSGEMIQLQQQRLAIAERLNVVLDSWEAKGGDVADYRSYVSAVTGLDLRPSDAAAAWSVFTGWATSQDGGLRWAWNFGMFALILAITYVFAKLIEWLVNWLLERKLVLSRLAERMISRTVENVVLVIGFAIALTALEVDITPILAAIGATGFIVGFALQGTLSNFASGLLILVNRPFDVGDVVSAGGVTGTVKEMNLVSTTFLTFDNQTIHVPNNEIWGSVITNITANENRRVDLEFAIGYGDNFEQAEQLIRDVVSEHPLVLAEPSPAVVLHELTDSCVKIVCRPWAKTSDWWTVKTEITRRVKQQFDRAGISPPYPHQDVHLHQPKSPVAQP